MIQCRLVNTPKLIYAGPLSGVEGWLIVRIVLRAPFDSAQGALTKRH